MHGTYNKIIDWRCSRTGS